MTESALRLAEAMTSEAAKEGKEYKPENLEKALPLLRDVITLNKKVCKAMNDLMICLQTRLLCEGKVPDKRTLRIMGGKEAWIEITDKEGTVFKVALKDVPHELRAHMLNQYANRGSHHRPNMYEARLFSKFRQLGWLEPEPPMEEPEDGS